MNQNKYLTLVRREFWEHRSLWLGPVIVATLVVVLPMIMIFVGNGEAGDMRMRGAWGSARISLPPGVTPTAAGVFGLSMPILVVAGIIVASYLLDSLYAERKDRSILFWKSLPVSDAATVLTKLAVAGLLVPLLAFLLALVVYPLDYGIVAMLSSGATVTGGWSTMAWLRAEGTLLSFLLSSLLWYAPVAAWLMLASVVARRMPVSFAVLPIVVLGVLESLLLQTGHVWRFVAERLTPIADPAEGIQRLDFWLRLDLWLGLAAAAAMIYIVIRLRRYRDDT